MNLIFETSVPGRGCSILPECDVSVPDLPETFSRKKAPRLPQLSENDISRHYTALAGRTYGVNNGFYPLGSCTMKYNPKINEELASLPGFTAIHPLQPEHTVQGAMKVLFQAEQALCEITGMDAMTFQPAAGAHGEFTGLLLIKAYHKHRGDQKRTKIIVPDSAHGTNPASATMAGFTVVSIPSREDGCVDLEKLKAAVGDDTAGLMLTNPNTVGLFDKNILEITRIVHDAGGLNYYDGANLNAVMGVSRPGDMGFDVVQNVLHTPWRRGSWQRSGWLQIPACSFSARASGKKTAESVSFRKAGTQHWTGEVFLRKLYCSGQGIVLYPNIGRRRYSGSRTKRRTERQLHDEKIG